MGSNMTREQAALMLNEPRYAPWRKAMEAYAYEGATISVRMQEPDGTIRELESPAFNGTNNGIIADYFINGIPMNEYKLEPELKSELNSVWDPI
jgi:hypothetical protein